MQPAEFEEREYEAPLYNQLASANSLVWSPGQVFEHHVGIDYAMFLEDEWIFRLHSLPVLPGAWLARYRWPRSWFQRRVPRRLPTFGLNLFLQSKRPSWGKRPPKPAREKGITGVFWRIDLDAEQQNALSFLATRLGKRALVLYAAPAFHDYVNLYKHTRRGTIASSSSFPSVHALQGHEGWFYNQPGAMGVANPDYVGVTEPGLDERIDNLSRTPLDGPTDWRSALKDLGANIRAGLSEENLAETPRRASFFDTIRAAEIDFRDIPDAEVAVAYVSVLAFCETYRVSWFTVTESLAG